MDEAHGQRPSRQPDDRPHRDRHRARPSRPPSTRRSKSEPSGGTGAGVNDDGSLMPPGQGAAAAVAADAAARTRHAPAPIPRRAASGDPTTAARRGGSCRTMAIAGCTTARSASIPTNPEIAYQGGAPFFKTVDGGKTLAAGAGDPAQRPSRDLDRSEERQPHPARQRRRPRRDLRPGGDVGVREHRPASASSTRSAPTCGSPTTSAAACRTTGAGAARAPRAAPNGILNSDWYPRRRRRRLLHRERSHATGRFSTRSRRMARPAAYDLRAGRSGSIRPSGTAGAQVSAATSRLPESADPEQPRRCRRSSAAAAATRTATSCHRRRPAPTSASTGTRRSSSRRTTRRTVYLGGDRLFRSYNRGDTWMASPDLTNNIGRNDRPIMGVDGKAPMASKHDGAASYSNIITIGESYVLPGVIWVGTNDGNVQLSRDGGVTWKNVVDKVPGVPKETHVSRVETVALRRRHRLRDFRRPSHRRSQGLRLHHEGLRRDVDVDLRQPAGGERQRHPRGSRRTATCCTSGTSTASTSR